MRNGMIIESLPPPSRDPEESVPDCLSLVSTRSTDKNEFEFDSEVEDDKSSLVPPPNGGSVAWLQVLAAFLGNFNSWGMLNAFGVYQEYYQTNLLRGSSPSQISWIFSLSGVVLLYHTPLYSVFASNKMAKILCLLACFFQFGGLLLLSWADKFNEILLVQGLAIGWTFSLLFTLTINAVSPYFSTKKQLAEGIAAAGSSIGGTVYSCMARRLISTVGFGWSTRIIAFVALATTVIMFFCLTKKRLSCSARKEFLAWECFTELPFILYSAGNMLGIVGLYTFYVYYESYATQIDPNRNAFLYMTAIVNAGSIVGSIISLQLAVKVGAINLLPFADLFSVILLFCWIPDHSAGGIITIGFLFGIVSRPIIGFFGIIISALTNDANRLGSRLSVLFIFMIFGFVLGPSIAGIIQRQYGWFWLKLYAALAMLLSLFCHIALRASVAGLRMVHA